MAGFAFRMTVGMGLVAALLWSGVARGEICTTQSQMTAADRDALAGVARTLAAKVQANDTAGLKAVTVPEYAKDFGGIAYVVGEYGSKGEGRCGFSRSGLSARRLNGEKAVGWDTSGFAVLLFPEPLADGDRFCDSWAASGEVWLCYGECARGFAVAAFVSGETGEWAVASGRTLSSSGNGGRARWALVLEGSAGRWWHRSSRGMRGSTISRLRHCCGPRVLCRVRISKS